jgi:putative drug exporter of the RND superfamily
VQYDESATSLPPETLDQLEAAADPAKEAGLRVEFGGPVVDYLSRDEGGNADIIGLIFAVIILLIAFGSLIAMSVPIGTALLGLGIGLSIISLIAAVTDIGTVAPTLATMIGLGVGIDYSLFIVTRHRQNLDAGMDVNESIGLANGTAGQAVLFAGGTVVIAITGLALSGIPYVTRLGLMAAVAVLVMMAAAVMLVPGLLGLAGRHINRVRAPRLRRKARGDRPPEGARRPSPFAHGRPSTRLGTLGDVHVASPVDGGDRQPRDPADVGRPGALDSVGSDGRRDAPRGPDPAPGLRPHLAGIRAGRERPATDRGRTAATR